MTHYIWLLMTLLLPTLIAKIVPGNHTNNWAVIACTSRYWFNYRHVANALSVYRSVKKLGLPDSHIILMLADEMPCNARNPRPATVFNNANQQINVYGDDVEVDYKGYEVTAENLVRVLTGRMRHDVPRSKRLMSDETSNVLVYLTGHGGDGFLKFQEAEEISNVELADAFQQMHAKGRYNELMMLIDTCQAASMYQHIYSPNVIAAASSIVGEDSLSHHDDSSLGVPVIDRWTYYLLQFLEKTKPDSKKTLADFFRDTSNYNLVRSHPTVRQDLFKRALGETLLTDFFGSVRRVEIVDCSNSTPILPVPLADDERTVEKEQKLTKIKYRYVDQFSEL